MWFRMKLSCHSYPSQEFPEAPWTKQTVEVAHWTLGSRAASCKPLNLLLQADACLLPTDLMELYRAKSCVNCSVSAWLMWIFRHILKGRHLYSSFSLMSTNKSTTIKASRDHRSSTFCLGTKILLIYIFLNCCDILFFLALNYFLCNDCLTVLLAWLQYLIC